MKDRVGFSSECDCLQYEETGREGKRERGEMRVEIVLSKGNTEESLI